MLLLTFACSPADIEIAVPPDPPATPSDEYLAGPEIACADPSVRETTPLAEADLGPDWAGQVQGDPETPGGWGLAAADFNGDDLLDLFLPGPGGDQLFFGEDDGTVRAAPFPAEADEGHGAAAADYDGDGDLDLYVANEGPDRLYRNDGGTFTDVSAEAGIVEDPWSGVGAAWGDMDGDTDLDLLVTNYYAADQHVGEGDDGVWTADPNLLYENLGDGTFAEVVDAFDTRGGEGFSFLAAWVDADGDGDQDIYVVNDKGADTIPNVLLVNDGAGHFTEDVTSYLDCGVDGMGLAVGDLNGDRIPDFVIPARAMYALLLSVGDGTWAESAASKGLTFSPVDGRVYAWGSELVDLDNDTRLDLLTAFGIHDASTAAEGGTPPPGDPPIEEPDALYIQNEYTRFVETSATWGLGAPAASRGIVVTDFNNDGVPDYLRRQVFGPSRVFTSACGDRHWTRLRLRDEGMNRFGIGARVVIEAEGQVLTRWLSAGSTSVASSAPPELHFGLGEATTLDRVEITWPDGEVQELWELPVDRVITIPRGH